MSTDRLSAQGARTPVDLAPGRTGQTITPRYRVDVALRTVAALVGGFVAAGAVCTALAAVLFQTGVVARGPAVLTGTMLTFLVWAVAAMWAFYARTHLRVWAGLLVPSIVGAVVAYVLGFEA